jgi:putative nucleotidyltransferase with HDIG domain
MYLYASLLFLMGMIAIFAQRNIEFVINPPNSVFWHKILNMALSGYILTFPLITLPYTQKKIPRFAKYLLAFVSLVCMGVVAFTDLVIKNQTIQYGHILLPLRGQYYPLFLTAVILIPAYFLVQLIKRTFSKDSTAKYGPLIFGICIGYVFCAGDAIGVLRGKPLIAGISHPSMFGIFIASVAFAWSFLSQYSWVFSSLTRSQSKIEKLIAKSNRNFIEFVQLIAKTLDAKDHYTAGHSLRVMDYAVKMAHALNLSPKEVDILKQACLLHDIGKISIPDGILNKKKTLTKKEREYIVKHPTVGKRILSTVSEFREILDIIYAHHERVDGTGYPDGRLKEEIPLLARILAVADTFDAMRSERPYRKAKSQSDAVKELHKVKGRQLDAELVDRFVELLESS